MLAALARGRGAPAGAWKLEVLAGLTTFLTMSYIAVVNPDILSNAGLDFGQVATATVLAAAFGSVSLDFLPAGDVVALIGAGAGLGLIASWFATGQRRALA